MARLLDGTDDKIVWTDIDALDGLAALSISCWFKPTAVGVGYAYSHLVTKVASPAASGWALQLGAAGDGPLFFIANTTYRYGAKATVFSAGTWYHIGAIYDGGQANDASKVKIYVGGSGGQQALSFGGTAASVPTSITANAVAVQFGKDQGADPYLKGELADVRIYNKALSTAELDNDFAGRCPSDLSALKFWCRLLESGQDPEVDRSATGSSGTLTGTSLTADPTGIPIPLMPRAARVYRSRRYA